MKKFVVALGLALVLACSFALAGCSGGGDSKQESKDPGIVSLDELKSGVKYLSGHSAIKYDECVEAFGNDGIQYDETDMAFYYKWKTDDEKNSVSVTFHKEDGNLGPVNGYSWSGNEISEYKKSLS